MFRVVIFADRKPQWVWRLAQRIEQDVPEARVCGILHQLPPRHTLRQKLGRFLSHARDPHFVLHLLLGMGKLLRGCGQRLDDVLLRLTHASQANPNGPVEFTIRDLVSRSRLAGWPTFVSDNLDSAAALDFARCQAPELGVVVGSPLLKPELSTLPRCGSIRMHKSISLPDEGGAGTEHAKLRQGPREVRISINRMSRDQDGGSVLCAVNLPREPYDTLLSLDLKSELIGSDLLVQVIGSFAKGAVTTVSAQITGWIQRMLPSHLLNPSETQNVQLHVERPRGRIRPLWKICLYTLLLFSPYVIIRNWYRRRRGGFPVIVLFHHLVSDRPHRLGISTEAFLREVRFLQRHYRVLRLPEAVSVLESNSVKVPTVVLTFDDGYQDNFVTLRAVMEETGVPVSLFVSTQLVQEQREFQHDQAKGEKNFRPLNWDQIIYLSDHGAEIGSHTRTHFDCVSTDLSALEEEIVGSKKDLEGRLGRPVDFFAFPWGKANNMSGAAIGLARSTYRYFFSTIDGENFPERVAAHRHLLRKGLAADLWELELSLQSVFDIAKVLKRMILSPAKRLP